MQKNGVILLIVLLCVAFLVSCGKRDTAELKQGELVRIETEGVVPQSFSLTKEIHKSCCAIALQAVKCLGLYGRIILTGVHFLAGKTLTAGTGIGIIK